MSNGEGLNISIPVHEHFAIYLEIAMKIAKVTALIKEKKE